MRNILESIVHIGIFSVPFVVLLVTETLFFPFITGKNFTFRILVEITTVAWTLLALYDVRYRPRFSCILAAFLAFLGVIFLANIFGEYPFKSFWSNFERMEGYITLVHMFLYFVVIGSALKVVIPRYLSNSIAGFVGVLGLLFIGKLFGDFGATAIWSYPMGLITLVAVAFFLVLVYALFKSTDSSDRLLTASLAVAVLLSWYAFAQFVGTIAVSQGGSWRIDGTLGNSTYMAVYMLFHIFFALLLLVRTPSFWYKMLYAFLAFTFVFIVLQTGTRGTTLGLIGGVSLSVLYIALFAKGQKLARNIALGVCTVLVILVGLFVTFRDTDFVQNDPRLDRIADITLEAGQTRFAIWTMAFEGVKERPILGWGQGNFDYVFSKYYNPALYGQEPWFDRVHNIVLDWLIAGGVIGALCYFGLFAAALYYLVVVPFIKRGDTSFSVVERGILLGLLSGYVFHNMFVFDNLISYIFFAVTLSYIHGRVATPIKKVEALEIETYKINNLYTPVAGVMLCVMLYVVNVPSIKAAGDMIDALVTSAPNERLRAFEQALSRGSFADQEIREQMVQQALQVYFAPTVSPVAKQEWFAKTEAEFKKQTQEKPGDARGLLLLASFYRGTNHLEEAKTTLVVAREVSPRKQLLIFEQGFVGLQQGAYEEALQYFKEAYDLAPEYTLARVFYALGAVFAGQPELIDTLITTDEHKIAFAENNTVLQGLYQQKEYDLVRELFELRVSLHTDVAEHWVNLAAFEAELGNTNRAIAVLEEAIGVVPGFKVQAEAFIAELRKGNAPQKLETEI